MDIKKFNTVLINFIKELSEIFPNFNDIKKYNNIDLENDSTLKEFKKNINNNLDLLSEDNINLIYKNLLGLDFTVLKISDSTKFTIMKYIKILYIQSYKYNKPKKEINTILKCINSQELSEQDQIFLKVFNSLKQKKPEQPEQPEQQLSEKDMNGINDMFKNMNLPGGELLGGSIGKLAMDIVKDIDVSKIDLGDPSKLLSSVMSGNFNESSGLMGLFGKITSKIKNKIDNGDVDINKLNNEAQSFMKNEQIKKMSSFTENQLFKNVNEVNQLKKEIKKNSLKKNKKNNFLNKKAKLEDLKKRLENKLKRKKN